MDEQEEIYTPEEMEEYGLDEEGYEIDGFDHWSHCAWCEELFPDSELKREKNLGLLCPSCRAALYSRGEKAVYIEGLTEEEKEKLSDDFVKDLCHIIGIYMEDLENENDDIFGGTEDSHSYEVLTQNVWELIDMSPIKNKEDLYNELIGEIVDNPMATINRYTNRFIKESCLKEDKKSDIEAIKDWLDNLRFGDEEDFIQGGFDCYAWKHEAHFGSAFDFGQDVMVIQIDNDEKNFHMNIGDIESEEELKHKVEILKDRLDRLSFKDSVKEVVEFPLPESKESVKDKEVKALIKDEEEAIAGYEKASKKVDDEHAKEVFDHIKKEEEEHIEELNALKSESIKEEVKENELFFVTDKNGLEIGYELEKNEDGSIHLYGSYNASNNAEGDDTEFEEDFVDEEDLNNWLEEIRSGYFLESLNEALGQDYSNIPLIDKFNFENKKQNNLPGIDDIPGFIKALEAVGHDVFKCRTTTFGKNIGLGDLKDAALDINKAGWNVGRTWDTSLDGFNEIYLCEKEKVDESLKEEKNLLEAPEKHDTLNPKLFGADNKLIPEVREKLLAIAKDFTDGLEEDEIKFDLKDIKIVGSNASYNYNDQSDIDLHLELGTKDMKCPDNLYPVLYDKVRSIWNKNNSPMIKGTPVEIFVETDDTKQMSEPDADLNEDIDSKYKDIFDGDYQRSYGIPTFQDETNIKILKGIYKKAVELDDELIKDSALDRLEELGVTDLAESLDDKDVTEEIERVLDDYGILCGDIVDNGDRINLVGIDESDWEEASGAIHDELGYEVLVPAEDHEELDDELIVLLSHEITEARKQTALKSNGIYSVLNDAWIKEPVAEDIPELDQEGFDSLLHDWKLKLEELKREPTIEKIEKFIEDLYDLRKTSIANDGEYGIGNLVFKQLRNDGDIDALKELKQGLKNKELSLEGLQEANSEESDTVKFCKRAGLDGKFVVISTENPINGEEVDFTNESVLDALEFIYDNEAEKIVGIWQNKKEPSTYLVKIDSDEKARELAKAFNQAAYIIIDAKDTTMEARMFERTSLEEDFKENGKTDSVVIGEAAKEKMGYTVFVKDGFTFSFNF